MIERADLAKTAAWSGVAALSLATHVAMSAIGFGPQTYQILSVLGFGLLLPAVATLHVRFTPVGPHGAILATLAGTATAILGLAAMLLDDLEPAALFVLGMWWWVVGKFVTETALLPRALGLVTSAIAVLAFACALGNVISVGRWTWTVPRLALAAWMAVLAAVLWRDARAPDGG